MKEIRELGGKLYEIVTEHILLASNKFKKDFLLTKEQLKKLLEEKECSGTADVLTYIKTRKQSEILEKIKKINKKYNYCCPVEYFNYPFVERYKKSVQGYIPLDSSNQKIIDAIQDIDKMLNQCKDKIEKYDVSLVIYNYHLIHK